MRKLTRYATWEYLKVFTLALVGMTMFMLLVGIAREAVREGLGPGPILRILPFIVPDSMRFSIPASALLAACTVFGRMSGDNEVVAVKSLGISPWVVMFPTFVLGFLISLFAVWINDIAVSWGRQGMSRVVSESIEQIAYGMLRTKKAFSTDSFSISVKSVDGRKLIKPTMSMHIDGELVAFTAHEAELRRRPDDDSLIISLSNVEGKIFGSDVALPTWEQEFDLTELNKNEATSPSDFPLKSIPQETVIQTQKIRRLEYAMTVKAGAQLFAADFGALQDEEWTTLQKQLRIERYRLNRLRTEPWRRWSNGFSCFFFVLIGAPWAIHRRNSDFVSSFFTAFLPIILIYYPLMAYGVDRAKEGAMPQYAVWLGNFVCAIVAGWLIRKVLRH